MRNVCSSDVDDIDCLVSRQGISPFSSAGSAELATAFIVYAWRLACQVKTAAMAFWGIKQAMQMQVPVDTVDLKPPC
jgi:hypothetical protein